MPHAVTTLQAGLPGVRSASVAPPFDRPADREDRFFRSYADRLAEAGWVADVDYGYTGRERYLFAPGSPRPPVILLDGFPADLGWVASGALEGWGGDLDGGGRASWPDGPGPHLPGGVLALSRYPAGDGSLLARLTLHASDVGAQDARVHFARRDAGSEWASSFGTRKEVASYLVEEYRARGLALAGARRARWGRWRVSLLSSTSDVVDYSPDFTGDKTRRELVRLGAGASSRDSVVCAWVVLGSAGDGSGREPRRAAAVRFAPRGLPLGGALGLSVQRDSSGGARATVQGSVGAPGWEAAASLDATRPDGRPRLLQLRGSATRALSGGWNMAFEGSWSAEISTPPGAGQGGGLSMLRVEPRLQWRAGRARAEMSVFVERDKGLDREPALEAYSTLAPAAVRDARSLGLRARAEIPGILRTRWGVSGFVQRTRDERGWRLPYQPPYAAHAFVAADRRTPLLPLDAHLRLTAHAEGERRGENDVPAAAHVTLDFETVLDYGQLHGQFGFYNFTDLGYETTFTIPGRPTLAAPAPGRSFRFGITWDLWN
ncbi:MAG: hypothetical protein HZB25_00270 [Candidatus Eisenbacteria bacterium]|nr:hypothetical protein [Candidatus Eisenbacteria bacterium]